MVNSEIDGALISEVVTMCINVKVPLFWNPAGPRIGKKGFGPNVDWPRIEQVQETGKGNP